MAEGKNKALVWAEIIDAFRAVPRVLMAGYIYLLWDAYLWMQTVQTALSRDVFYAIMGAAAIITGFYLNSGRKWGSG